MCSARYRYYQQFVLQLRWQTSMPMGQLLLGDNKARVGTIHLRLLKEGPDVSLHFYGNTLIFKDKKSPWSTIRIGSWNFQKLGYDIIQFCQNLLKIGRTHFGFPPPPPPPLYPPGSVTGLHHNLSHCSYQFDSFFRETSVG